MKLALSKWELLLLALLAVGVFFSLKDYQKWHRSEFDRYGQGPVTNQLLAPALSLHNRYQNVQVHVRMAYPDTWKVTENPATADPRHTPVITDRVEIVHFDAGAGVTMSLTAEKVNLSLGDATDAVAKKVTLTRDREYISNGKTSFTILTWTNGSNTYQAAYAKPGDILFTLTAVAPTSVWTTYEKTFSAMYSSLIPL